jgi:hypothetical protein
MFVGTVITLMVAIAAGLYAAGKPHLGVQAAAAVNMNCTLIVPPNPLSAQGLMTPYQLVATNPAQGPCNEANPNQSAFVQATILDPATGNLSAYEPLVIDQGTQPAVAPAPVTLPPNAIVALWFGDNGNVLSLLKNNAKRHGNKPTNQPDSKQAAANAGADFTSQKSRIQLGNPGNCVNGTPNSPFGQFAYCNAPQFFQAAQRLIKAGKITIPPLGTANDGKPCPTTEDFSLVDMDQSDNVQTLYLANANGQIAQFSAANQAAIQNATQIGNPSDNALLSKFVDPAQGCTAWAIPDQVNNNTPTATYATDALQAMNQQGAPRALVPGGDPMVLVNGQQNLQKVNLFRMGADEPPARSLTGNAATDANTTTYCQNIVNIGLPRLQMDMQNFQNHPSPDGGATANSLFTFLANRMNATLGAGGLNCVGLLNIQNPIALTTDGNGVVTAATLTVPPVPANNSAANNGAANNGAANNGAANNGAANNGAANNGAANNGAANNGTANNGTANNGAAVTPTPATTTPAIGAGQKRMRKMP